MSSCYYRRRPDGVFESTDLTRSNWTPEIQHGSPPLALLTKAVEEQLADTPMRIGRLSLDILGAVPVEPMQVRTWVDRPGRRISLLAAEMTPVGQQRPVARVTAWALAVSDTADAATERHPPLVEGATIALPDGWWNAEGYLESVDFRRQQDDCGSRVFWLTPKVALVDDEPTTALQRLTMVVDSANGVGSVLDPQEYMFMNTDTVLHLHRLPTGADFALRARGSIGSDGIGVTTAEVYDRAGFVGTSAQTLLVQRR
ncbi:thioesterase [Mycobacterium sp. MS1601]|uniref:thioesterase family protein n=1 Tax=Mycobacterium sp. MS1601 TaxID=1936029 RepID=UPI0009797F82|nr:thioesterase family protein [Mycobacterium sp. MS1601]AQA04935.1 thioesterase [Mycobacterium sp. MS1601]